MARTALGMVKKIFPDVEKVKDAKRKVEITLRPQDNRYAIPQRADRCAMARACKRELGLDGALVSTAVAYLVKGKQATRYAVPERVSREIVSFDRNHEFAPGTYRLIPPETGQGIGRGHVKRTPRPAKRRVTAKRLSTFGIRKRMNATTLRAR